MQETKRLDRNRRRLEECHEVFAEALKGTISDLESQGLRPRIQAAWRSPEEQLAAFNSGNSELKFGFHNVTGPDGRKESLAVDLLDDDAPLSPANNYVLRLAAAARAQGLQTGVLWGLRSATRQRIDKAIAAGEFDAPGKVGWDPCHVEITGLTPTQAKQGQRPSAAGLTARAAPGPAPVAPRSLLVRAVGGPAKARAGETATYRATSFNLTDPTAQEKAQINWTAQCDGQTVQDAKAAGDQWQLDIPEGLAGKTIRVMAYRNSPAPRVSVLTSVQAAPVTVVASDETSADLDTLRTVSLRRDGTRYHASVNGGPSFFVGSDVRYLGARGLMNTSDMSGVAYDPEHYQDRHGFWAQFIHPTALCESSGYFQRLNTYDRARFTFGFFQHAVHTPEDNFILLMRKLLAQPLGQAYFPDLVLQDGAIHRHTESGLVRLETRTSSEALMMYLNPARAVVDDAEAVNAAKFVHWSASDQLHRETQVEFTIAQMRKKMASYSRRYGLHGTADTVCLVVADIRHQGRARSAQIIEALESDDALGKLLRIGEDGFPQRIETLGAAIDEALTGGTLGNRVYDQSAGEFRLA